MQDNEKKAKPEEWETLEAACRLISDTITMNEIEGHIAVSALGTIIVNIMDFNGRPKEEINEFIRSLEKAFASLVETKLLD